MSDRRFKVAGVQMDIGMGEPHANLARMRQWVDQSSRGGARLTVFPECTTTGYCFESLDQALPFAESPDGPSVHRVSAWANELDHWIVFGLLERSGDRIYNSLALVGPDGLAGWYRKTHLPYLGVDRFTSPGEGPYEPIETPFGKIGLLICYDSSFPEAARSLALNGADLVVLPTNWPPTSGLTADVVPAARALENHLYFMAIDRVGSECGVDFIGKSRICDPHGATLAIADHDSEAILFAEIDPELARQKHLVNIPGEHEVDRFRDRRPELYGALVRAPTPS